MWCSFARKCNENMLRSLQIDAKLIQTKELGTCFLPATPSRHSSETDAAFSAAFATLAGPSARTGTDGALATMRIAIPATERATTLCCSRCELRVRVTPGFSYCCRPSCSITIGLRRKRMTIASPVLPAVDGVSIGQGMSIQLTDVFSQKGARGTSTHRVPSSPLKEVMPITLRPTGPYGRQFPRLGVRTAPAISFFTSASMPIPR